MPIRGERTILSLGPVLRDGPVAGRVWFDAHTHMGQRDPDGVKGTPEEILRASTTPATPARCCSRCTSPTATQRAQRRGARGRARRRGGRLRPSAASTPTRRARSTRRGAASPPARRRDQAAPAQRRLRAAASGRRASSSRSRPPSAAPVLFHAGRGIPNLGRGRRPPRPPSTRPRGSSSPTRASATSGCCATHAAELPNLLFDTVVVADRRHARRCSRTRPARADPLRERHALRARPAGVVHPAARRPAGRAGRRSRSPWPPARSSSGVVAGEELHDLGPARAPPRSVPARRAWSAWSATRPARCSSRSAAATPPRRSRSRGSAASTCPATSTPSCSPWPTASSRSPREHRAGAGGDVRALRRPPRCWPHVLCRDAGGRCAGPSLCDARSQSSALRALATNTRSNAESPPACAGASGGPMAGPADPGPDGANRGLMAA